MLTVLLLLELDNTEGQLCHHVIQGFSSSQASCCDCELPLLWVANPDNFKSVNFERDLFGWLYVAPQTSKETRIRRYWWSFTGPNMWITSIWELSSDRPHSFSCVSSGSRENLLIQQSVTSNQWLTRVDSFGMEDRLVARYQPSKEKRRLTGWHLWL